MIIKPRLFRKPNLSHPLSTGLVGLWLMNEGSGNKVQDLSGNGNTGTLIGDTAWVPGKFGPTLNFDGAGDYVNCGGATYLGTGSAFSISLWAKQDALTDDKGIITKYRTGDNQRSFYFATTGDTYEIETRLSADGINNIMLISTNDAGFLVAGTWYHFVFVFNGVNMKYYRDGILKSTNASAYTSIHPGTAQLDIGARYNSDSTFNGDIDNVSIYNCTLSASEIQQLYREPFCMFDRDQIELWSAVTQGGGAPVGNAGIMTCNTGFWGATY